MGRHLPYGITQFYLPPDTREHAPPNPSQVLDLLQSDGKLSWPRIPGNAQVWHLNHYTMKPELKIVEK